MKDIFTSHESRVMIILVRANIQRARTHTHTQEEIKTADDDAYHSTPPITDRLLESSAEQLCVNGFKKEKDVFKTKK